ncbi:MAG: type IV-A pilus assembly ATPase PilB [candidate division Zixibacteria bacterium]|nr:type IV-A pilus assembly ATPase PilB [candidate division Zixibacteria bacterium]
MMVQAGRITAAQLQEALDGQQKSGEKFVDILLRMGAVADEDELTHFIGRQLNIGALRLADVELDPEVVKLIPLDIARRFNVIAVSKVNKTLVVAISDPHNIYVLDAIKFITGCSIQPVISPERAISRSIDQYYADTGGMTDLIKGLEDGELQVIEADDQVDEMDLQSQVQDKPLVKLVDKIIMEAIQRHASDIHIESYETRIRVRYRVDGQLRETQPLPFKYRAAIVSRIKIMADLDISERRLPQDGRIKVKFGKRAIDLRVSVLPTIFGEKVVMRILDPEALMADLTKLGFPENALNSFKKAISLPYGMILVTGPTGSGKTTTLYSALKTLNRPEVNILTAEDPVEFNFEGINQVLVRADIGLNFAATLRSFLRQDPDIVMVGEIRDGETADIAIRAALTGHLVFSTLHTNDAPSTIHRLVDMGVPNYLVASAAKLIMAQRMTRRICPTCREEIPVTPEHVAALGMTAAEAKDLHIFAGKGCGDCSNTGMAGRIGIFEVMPVTKEIERMILENAPVESIRQQAIKEGMLTLRMAAMEKMNKGQIPFEQVLGESA